MVCVGLWAMVGFMPVMALAETKSVAIVELFTSQGCSSCPPADALLSELSHTNDDVIALAHHVDYWNYIGWEDPFSSPHASMRQRSYVRVLSNWTSYTPQMVVDGAYDVAGYKRDAVFKHVGQSLQSHRVKRLSVEHSLDGEQAQVMLPLSLREDFVVWVVGYDGAHETHVERGENRGRRLINTHVVRHMDKASEEARALGVIIIDIAGEKAQKRAGVAVLVQDGEVGPIVAAADVRF